MYIHKCIYLISHIQVVLGGDPKQLGPVIHSPAAKKQGLDTSLLERLVTRHTIYAESATGSINVCVCVCQGLYVRVCVVNIYVYIYMYIYVYICIYVYI